MFLPFKTLTTRQSAAYAVLCVALMAGIKYLDEHTPERDPMKAKGDTLAWSDMDAHAAQRNARSKPVEE